MAMEESMGRRPHVVMVPTGAAGHAIPFLQLARSLVDAGVVVTLATSDRHVAELEAKNFEGGEEERLRFVGFRDGSSVHLSHMEFMRGVRSSFDEQKRMVKLLLELIRDVGSPESQKLRGVPPAPPPVCVLHDMFSAWSQGAAEELDMETDMLYVSPMSCLSASLQAGRLAQEGRIPITRENVNRLISDIPGLPPMRPLDLPSSFLDVDTYDGMRHYFRNFAKASVILGNSFYALEGKVIDALRAEVLGTPGVQINSILDIGPLLPESHFRDDVITPEKNVYEENNPCLSWLDTQAPSSVLFVSFGSDATHTAPQLLSLALGLEASGHPFLWIVRPPGLPSMSEAFSRAPASITEFLPPGYEERVKGRGMCYSGWAPQTQILKHSATGGFLSHCGWNSILESVCAGIPILAWSKQAEQHLNSRFLVDSVKLALVLREEGILTEDLQANTANRFVTIEEITQKVKTLMQEEEGELVRKNMQRMKMSARNTVAPEGSSQRNFEAYLKILHDRATEK